MHWIDFEPLRFLCPTFADELVRRQALKGLQALGEFVGHQEGLQMVPEVLVRLVAHGFN